MCAGFECVHQARDSAFCDLAQEGLELRQIVHHDDVAFRERGNETFFHPFLEGCRIHRLIESLLGHEARETQTGDERDGLIMAVGNADAQPTPSPATPAFARQICGSAGLINENTPSRIEVELPPKPPLALLQYVRALLLLGMRGFFFKRDPVAIEEAPDHG